MLNAVSWVVAVGRIGARIVSRVQSANELIDPWRQGLYSGVMNAVEFTTELSANGVLQIPSEAAAQLPKSGRARVIVLTQEDGEDAEWRHGAYQQFLRDDSAEDAIYDSYR